MAYRIKYYGPAFVYVILIVFLSSLNQTVVTNFSWGIEDFILHVTEYHIFGIALIWAFFREKPATELKQSYRLAIGLGTLFAMADEFYQSFIPSRFSSIDDVVADTFGLILSIITFSLLMRIPALERFRIDA